jgi:hypothetical protein
MNCNGHGTWQLLSKLKQLFQQLHGGTEKTQDKPLCQVWNWKRVLLPSIDFSVLLRYRNFVVSADLLPHRAIIKTYILPCYVLCSVGVNFLSFLYTNVIRPNYLWIVLLLYHWNIMSRISMIHKLNTHRWDSLEINFMTILIWYPDIDSLNRFYFTEASFNR